MKQSVIILAACFIVTGQTNAQLRLPEVFRQPVEQAILKSKELHNKELDMRKANLERRSVQKKNLPRVQAMAGYGYLNNEATVDIPAVSLPVTGMEIFAGKSNLDNEAQVVHGQVMAKSILYSGNQIKNGSKALDQKALGDSLLMETEKDRIIADVIGSFDQLTFLKASKALIFDSERRLATEEERVNKGIDNGLAIPFDRDKIKLARLELESKKTQVEESEKVLLEKITYLTGLSREDIQAFEYELLPIVLQQGLRIDNKQELQALEAYKKAGEYLVQKEKGSFLPAVAAFAGISYTNLFAGSMNMHLPHLPAPLPQPNLRLNEFAISPNFMAGVLVKWDIFTGYERKHKLEEARLNVKQLENKLEDSRDKLSLLLMQKQAVYTTQWKHIDLANQQEVIAGNALTMAHKQYVQGLISVSQRLEAENDYLEARQKKVEVLVQERRSAIDVLLVTGNIHGQIEYK